MERVGCVLVISYGYPMELSLRCCTPSDPPPKQVKDALGDVQGTLMAQGEQAAEMLRTPLWIDVWTTS